MTRVAYTDLFLNFKPSINSKPKTAELVNIIIKYYKDAYMIVYPDSDKYNATDDDTSDPDGIIQSNNMFNILQGLCSNYANKWHEAGTHNDGVVTKMPSTTITPEEIAPIKKLCMNIRGGVIDNIEVWDDGK